VKIVVCVKRVPDTEARIRVGSDGSSIDPSGVKFILNPYDEFAVEAALRLRDSSESGEVTVLSVGSSESAETLRTTLAMGADQAVLLKTAASPEGLAVAEVIAAELRERDFDIALFGMKAIDDDLQAVGAMVAEILELPSATVVMEFAVDRGTVTAQRAIEGGIEIVDLKLPCVLTITKGAYEARYPSLKGIMAAKKKPLEEKAVDVTEARVRIAALEPPLERSAGRIVGEGPDAVPELLKLLREEARVI
jgi:electron transfer flavoprotein beta subunit